MSTIQVLAWSVPIFNRISNIPRPEAVNTVWEEEIRANSLPKAKNTLEGRSSCGEGCAINEIEILTQEHSIELVNNTPSLVPYRDGQGPRARLAYLHEIREPTTGVLFGLLSVYDVKRDLKRRLLQAFSTAESPVHVYYTCLEQSELKLQIAKGPRSCTLQNYCHRGTVQVW